MEEKKLLIFNKPHNVLGSTDTDLILQTKGNIKIRWHNRKFIDLIKNGKINSEGSLILKKVSSEEDIKEDGIYIVGDKAVISVDGLIIDLSSLGDSSYISFLIPLNITSELKFQALTNAGFYYQTLEDARTANIEAGLVYIVDELKLYLAENGQLTEFFILPLITEEEKELNFDELWIGDRLHLYNKDNDSIIEAISKLMLSINGDNYITLESNLVSISKNLVVHDMVQSSGATTTTGFRIYMDKGKSVLEIDDIIWRNKKSDFELPNDDVATIYSTHNNVILSAEQGDSDNKVVCKLKYSNLFKAELKVYVFLEYNPRITAESGLDGITVGLEGNLPVTEDVTVEVEYSVGNSSYKQTVTIPKGSNNVIIPASDAIVYSCTKIEGPESITAGDIINKNAYLEFTVDSVDGQLVTLDLGDFSSNTFINKCENANIHVANAPFMKIESNTLDIYDRSKLIEDKIDETIHTKIGAVKESKLEFLKTCPKDPYAEEGEKPTEKPKEVTPPVDPEEEKKEILVGIYSDNFIGLNSKLYDTIFKKRCDYPKYDESIIIPEKFLDKKYNLVVPDIDWIKKLMDWLIPKGTIVMYNGNSKIPEGWAICDGTKGTPNLIGRFIKASTTAGLKGGSTSISLSTLNMPSHSHSISGSGSTSTNGSHSHSVYYGSQKVGDNANNIDIIGGGSSSTTTSNSGSHSHSVDFSSVSIGSSGGGLPLTWEPSYYSLIFIMRL